MQTLILLSSLLCLSSVTVQSSVTDTISSGQSLTWNDTLTSKGGNFELGFFKPGNSLNYYVGIWYKRVSIQNKTYVWVANRNTPITDPTSSELKLLGNGNLVLLSKSNTVVWSTNSTSNSSNSSHAVLGNDGDLVIRNGKTGLDVLWESFDHLTDTILPGGKIGYHYMTRNSDQLTAWSSADDPSEGLYSLALEPDNDQFILQWGRNLTYWSSGRWDGHIFSAIPEMASINYYYDLRYLKTGKDSYFTYMVYNTSLMSRIVIDEWGQINLLAWDEKTQQWDMFWSQPRGQCSVFGYCGFFSVCNKEDGNCQCMKGFIPQKDSITGNCVKEDLLQCGGRNDTFALIQNVPYPKDQIALNVSSASGCRSACLNSCNCTAYNYSSVCSIWTDDLRVAEGDEAPRNIYVRLAASEINKLGISSNKRRTNVGVIIGSVAVVLVSSCIIGSICWKLRRNRNGSSQDIALRNENQRDDQLELPLFSFVEIATATDDFCSSNKIGQGGFGPVYKGILPSGEEIAIKRLSTDSRQGLQEFMNEVILIAKLQHRNLVRLLGCCIQGDDRMLIYEYMPNKSLDFFIFDKRRSASLNWNVRFDIIVGIARGLLYLHRDSRLRIIHRDLKAANVLLDGEMNPKISDFGMARTFGANQTEENTMRVVGTYGYMSPEYAMEGLFSMKSDVFSFGVIVLEIVSGRRNRGFHHADHDLNLLGHVWKLLKANRALECMDSAMKDSLKASEVLKCIQVGLLCVQKFPEDRPTMPIVLSMLDGDGTNLPYPKQPGFYTERCPFQQNSSSSHDKVYTGNDATNTLLEGR